MENKGITLHHIHYSHPDFCGKSKLCKALSDQHRLRILDLLHNDETYTCSLTDEMNMPQSSPSAI